MHGGGAQEGRGATENGGPKHTYKAVADTSVYHQRPLNGESYKVTLSSPPEDSYTTIEPPRGTV